MFEQLESRRLMTGAMASFRDGVVAQVQGDGSLSIQGNPKLGMNVVVIEDDISQLPNGVHIGLGNLLVKNMATGEEGFIYNVKPGKAIRIQGSNGGDSIAVDLTTLTADIAGNNGDDTITLLERGSGGSRVDGGNGNDQLNLIYSANVDIQGGNGNDVIALNTGVGGDLPFNFDTAIAHVDAGNGDDTITIYSGNAVIDGGHGNDTLIDNSGSSASYVLFHIENTILL